MGLQLRQDLDAKFRRIGISRDYSDLDINLSPDMQGWGSHSPMFAKVLGIAKPSLVIEIGTWKGASVINMAKLAISLNLDCNFICIDTWLGSNDILWIQDDYRASLLLKGGYPSMFRQFIANIVHEGVHNVIYPLPMTSSSAYYLLRRLEIEPDVIYIDAGHEEEEVYIDLKLYFELLRPGGIMFGDDYTWGWPGVVAAVNRFAAERRLQLECGDGNFMFQKPSQQADKTAPQLGVR
jgi:hypothetical protein